MSITHRLATLSLATLALSLIPLSAAPANDTANDAALVCLTMQDRVTQVEVVLLTNTRALENVRNDRLIEQKKLRASQQELAAAKKALASTAKGSPARTGASTLVKTLSSSVTDATGKISVMNNAIKSFTFNGKKIASELSNARAAVKAANC